MGSADALERFERQTALPMLILALISLPLLAVPLIWDLSTSVDATIFALDWIIWATFATEYVIRLYLAPAKRSFMRSNIVDLLVVVLPFLRPLRIMRSARMLRILRLTRGVSLVARAGDAARDVAKSRRLNYTLLVAVVMAVGCAFVVLELERGRPGANIENFADAIWWAVTTVTTVGYGDTFPTTAGGRGVGVFLMILGIAIFGFLTASIAAIFVRRDVADPDKEGIAEIIERLERIERRLRERPSDQL